MPEPEALFVGGAIVLFAAVARGFFGFGFSALCVATLSFLAPPSVVVPLVFMMEIVASVWMLPGVWREVDWRWILPVVAGMFVGTPAGVWLLSSVPPDAARLGVCLLAAMLAATVAMVGAKKIPPLSAPAWAVGVATGIVNGAAAMGGLVAALFLLSSRGAAQTRASLAVMFLAGDLYALSWGGGMGLVSEAHFRMLALSALPLAAGIVAGTFLFRRFGERNYRPLALGLILAIAAFGAGKEIWEIAAGGV